MKKLILVRHGDLDSIYDNKFVGSLDVTLSDIGRERCRLLREEFQSYPVEKIYVSPMKRTLESLEIISPNSTAQIDHRLREINFGTWENIHKSDLHQIATSEELEMWQEHPELLTFPTGDIMAEFYTRVDTFIDEILATPYKCVALVTHGGVIMRILCRYYNLPNSKQFELLPRRGTITIIEY